MNRLKHSNLALPYSVIGENRESSFQGCEPSLSSSCEPNAIIWEIPVFLSIEVKVSARLTLICWTSWLYLSCRSLPIHERWMSTSKPLKWNSNCFLSSQFIWVISWTFESLVNLVTENPSFVRKPTNDFPIKPFEPVTPTFMHKY